MASGVQISAIKGAKVLIVGAGGIGCELLKILAVSGFEDIHIIDMDTIETSNLMTQFLFRQAHVGQPKAKVARDAVLRFRPKISITPYHANVKDCKFNVDFFKQFSVVLNGLDNLDARRHVNRLCLAADVPLVESGTSGFLGQVTLHIKGQTECYDCQPKQAQKPYPECVIASTPSKFVHCIVWAKDLLFAKLFGDKNQDYDLNVRSHETATSSDLPEDVFELRKDEDIQQFADRIYDHVFGHGIQTALSNEETWNGREKPRPIYVKDVMSDEPIQQFGNADDSLKNEYLSSLSAMECLGWKNPHDIWSLKENSKVFFGALKLFFTKRQKEIGKLTFDKDDPLAVEFITAAANIRATSFSIPLHSLFEAKGIAGNIVHTVATTNAIIAGLIVIEAIKVLQNDAKNCRMTYCLEHPSRKMLLMPVELVEPNELCYVCSEHFQRKMDNILKPYGFQFDYEAIVRLSLKRALASRYVKSIGGGESFYEIRQEGLSIVRAIISLFNLGPLTHATSIQYYDTYLSTSKQDTTSRSFFDCELAIHCVRLAAKVFEGNSLDLKTLEDYSSPLNLGKGEANLLERFDWKLFQPTLYTLFHTLRLEKKVGFSTTDDVAAVKHADTVILKSLEDAKFLAFTSHHRASAFVFLLCIVPEEKYDDIYSLCDKDDVNICLELFRQEGYDRSPPSSSSSSSYSHSV